MAMSSLITPVSVVEAVGCKFVILDAPNDSNIHFYLEELKKENVGHVVRVCDPTYETACLQQNNIIVHDWPFNDGDPPPDSIITSWLTLVKACFGDKKSASDGKKCIGIHCVAGLGRAPVMVAIALIEKGMDPLDAVQTIRGRRRGAINAKQLNFLQNYKRKSKKDCVVM